MCGTVCEQKQNGVFGTCVWTSLILILKSYYFFAIPQYFNHNFKDLWITDIKQTISKSYKNTELF